MAKTEVNGEIVHSVQGPKYANEDLSSLTSFEEAMALVQRELGEAAVVDASQAIGDGFKMLDNKDLLCGVEFLAIGWNFTMGDFGEFVAAKVVTRDGQKYVLIDGSTGIYQQISEYSGKTGRMGGLWVKNGLRKSEYEYEDESTGKLTPAVTYYLDVSA